MYVLNQESEICVYNSKNSLSLKWNKMVKFGLMETNMLHICCKYHAAADLATQRAGCMILTFFFTECSCPTWEGINLLMDGILQTTLCAAFSWKIVYFESNFTEVFPLVPIANKSELVQVMAWHRTGDMTLPEPMIIQFPFAYDRLQTS